MYAIAALFGALALFWLSTRQFALIWRVLIWIAGVALLGLAAWFSFASPSQFGLWRAVSDSVSGVSDWRDASVVRALALNAGFVAQFFWQLLDFFVFAGVLVGLLALLAFSKGERLERVVRPLIFSLLAFVIGCSATLAVVAVGFGGYARPRTFVVGADSVDIQDGDTFRTGEYSLRLYGIDAPESDQVCLRNGAREECGRASTEALGTLLRDGARCDQMLSRSGRPRDGLGRALVRCWTDGDVDIANELIRQGLGVQYRGENYGYGAAETDARMSGRGLWGSCTLRPDHWRDKESRRLFLANGMLPHGVSPIGACATTSSPS